MNIFAKLKHSFFSSSSSRSPRSPFPDPSSPRSMSAGTIRLRWRPVDIAVGAALGVACGLVFWGFNYAYVFISPFLRAVLPGVTSIVHAFWYFSGPLAVLVLRKPGAAIYVNIVGSLAEMIFGSGGFSFSFVFISAALQGICSELPFAVTRYRVFNPAITVTAGALTAVEYGFYLLFFQFQGVAFLSPRGITHMICEILGGVLFAGIMSWALYRAIAKTGALERFASGRDVRRPDDDENAA